MGSSVVEDTIYTYLIEITNNLTESAQITQQPMSHVLIAGPSVGDTAHITLICEAEGWPLPSFQWYVNKRRIPGAVKPELRLTLKCPSSAAMRSFRCTRCRMMSKSIPINAFHIKCGNCGYRVDFKEVRGDSPVHFSKSDVLF